LEAINESDRCMQGSFLWRKKSEARTIDISAALPELGTLSMDESTKLFDTEAENLCSALISALPEGTLKPLLKRLQMNINQKLEA